MLPKWGGRLSSEGQRGESRMGRGQEQADLVKLKMAFRPQLIRPLSSHVLRCSCDLSSVCFHTSFVKIIRLMNENISNVELGEMLNSHPWAPGSSRDRSPGGEERDGGNPRVRSGLSQTLQLARAGDDYVCLLRGRSLQLQVTVLSASLLKFHVSWMMDHILVPLTPDRIWPSGRVCQGSSPE